MPRKNASHLKLHTEESSNHQSASSLNNTFDLTEMLSAFTAATGWVPRPIKKTPHHPDVPSDDKLPPLRTRMQLISTHPIDGALDSMIDGEAINVTSEQDAWALLEQLDHLIQQVKAAEGTIELQEARLATAVGVSIRKDEAELLTGRLKETLKRAVEQTASDAAAIYLLDDSTSELKMRACHGLSSKALTSDARPLRGALADLEALMGNAVLVENTKLAPEWNCPEDFAAAFCLPIGSPTMPQGTLWLWSQHVRDFGNHDIEIAKSASDKVLVDIERSILADEVLRTRSTSRQLESASMIQASRLPSLQPLHRDYEVGGWTFQGQSLGGNFHTWTYNRHDRICAALGSAMTSGPTGALIATSIQTVVETCWNTRHKPSQVLQKANDILWDIEDADWRSSLCYLNVHPASGSTELALAGDIQVFLVSSRGVRAIGGTPTPLAEQPDTKFFNEQLYLEGGELLVVASSSVVGGAKRGGMEQGELLEVVSQMQEDSVEDIADHLARLLPMGPVEALADSPIADRSLMVIRRSF